MIKQAKYGVILYVCLAIPFVANFLESIMVTHMLIQMPLLIVSGWLMTSYIEERFDYIVKKWNKNGVAGIILVIIITTYWMIPRTMDEALQIPIVELFKFISLPFLVGCPLRLSWKRLSSVWRSFIGLNYISMFAFMAWLYIDSPVQICNNYLEIEQQLLGRGFLLITVAIVLYILQFAFIDQSKPS